ncbi:DNA polymerase thumb domain-containing protein [Evansella cellulosilytica]|uniref:Y-family DNA polymerase n=1 Tax=Evansella cellulosilytica TaxID=1413 RepID=UPI00059FC4E8|nr:UV damage repair protein UvrX [Evansella cellulosilytica]
MDYDSLPKRTILCIDMKSFYASCAAIALGEDPLTSHLAVVGDTAREGSVILAATPALKRDFGIKTGNRLFEVPKDSKIKLVNASMATYLSISVQVTALFQQYVPPEAIHTYSVDESFLDICGTEKIWGNDRELALKIRDDLFKRFGLSCAIGIGPNMLMSKVCLDIEAKNQPSGIAKWTYADVKTKLWQISPLQKMWGIGSKIEARLHRLGIFSIGHLANYRLDKLEKVFGVMGNQLYYHAWGIDFSEVGAPILNGQISYGKSQILMRDYTDKLEIKRVILEMCEEVAARARRENKAGQTISLGIGYSKVARERGFHRQLTVVEPTNITMELYEACLKIFDKHYNGSIVRQVSISLANICGDDVIQLNLFDQDQLRPKKRDLGYVMDAIRKKHGPNAVLRAVSYANGGTARHRNTLVGGHKQ